jgi:hypothetical protein
MRSSKALERFEKQVEKPFTFLSKAKSNSEQMLALNVRSMDWGKGRAGGLKELPPQNCTTMSHHSCPYFCSFCSELPSRRQEASCSARDEEHEQRKRRRGEYLMQHRRFMKSNPTQHAVKRNCSDWTILSLRDFRSPAVDVFVKNRSQKLENLEKRWKM